MKRFRKAVPPPATLFPRCRMGRVTVAFTVLLSGISSVAWVSSHQTSIPPHPSLELQAYEVSVAAMPHRLK